MKTDWTFLHPQMTFGHLGYLPQFLSDSDPRPAKEQFDSNYIGGWQEFKGFRLNKDNSLSYPSDPPQKPLAQTYLRDELIVFYPSSWVAIIQKDRSFEVARLD